MACGAVCRAAQIRLGIPAVTGMYRENPAVEIYSRDVTILEAESTAKGMPEVLPKMVDIVTRLAAGQALGVPPKKGIFQEASWSTGKPSTTPPKGRSLCCWQRSPDNLLKLKFPSPPMLLYPLPPD